MRRIVPVIGHEFFDVAPSLHERVVDLVHSLGFECFLVSTGNIRELHNADPMLTEIPFIVVSTRDHAFDILDIVDLITPLVEKFPSASIVRNIYTEIPKAIYRHSGEHLPSHTKFVS